MAAMGFQHHSPSRNLGCKEAADEIWEASSNSGSEADGDSEADSEEEWPTLSLATRVAPSDPPSPASSSSDPLSPASSSSGRSPRQTLATSSPVSLRWPHQLRQQQAKPEQEQQKDAVQLLRILRQDNTKLREALVEAQRETETMALELDGQQHSNDAGIDFGHLMALVKEFDDGLGCGASIEESFVGDSPSPAVQIFAMDSPRSVASCSDISNDVARLREALDASRREAAQLRALLGTRDGEVAAGL